MNELWIMMLAEVPATLVPIARHARLKRHVPVEAGAVLSHCCPNVPRTCESPPGSLTIWTGSVNTSSNLGRDFYTMPDVDPASTSTSGGGIWEFGPAGVASSQCSTQNAQQIVAHQDRLGSLQPNGLTLAFSNPGESTSFPTVFQIGTVVAGMFAWAQPQYPGDLTIVKTPRGVFDLQGTIPSVIIREAVGNLVSGQTVWSIQTPWGLVIPTLDEGVYLYSGASTPENISAQFVGSPMLPSTAFLTSPTAGTFPTENWFGHPTYAHWWLFFPTGHVYDFRIKAWFKLTLPGKSPYAFWDYDLPRSKVFAAGGLVGTPRVISSKVNEQTMPRASMYSFTLPVTDLDQGRVVPREVAYHVQTYAPGCSITTTITWQRVGGGVQTSDPIVSVLDGGKHQIVRQHLGQPGSLLSQWFTLRATFQAPPGSEAPTLDRLLIGLQDGAPVRAT